MENKYCIFRNSCKTPYRCCNFCKKDCQDRCKDDFSKCKYCTNSEPKVEQKFQVEDKPKSIKPKQKDELVNSLVEAEALARKQKAEARKRRREARKNKLK